MSTPEPSHTTPPCAAPAAPPAGFRRRLLWLLGCTLGGLGVGLLGQAWSGDQAWFLALPAAIALGWLFIGTPQHCSPSACPDSGGSCSDAPISPAASTDAERTTAGLPDSRR